MNFLVGHSGFVGSNLSNKIQFDGLYNSKNIEESFGKNPDLLIYSGIRAEKFLANSEPENDFLIVQNAIENIKKINPKKVVLISTIDVYPSPILFDETTEIDDSILHPYGKNRLFIEKWVEDNFDEYLIVRLPGLIGENIKKNFVFDIINVIPSMLNEKLYQQLLDKNDWIATNYKLQENGFYKLRSLSENEKNELKNKFLSINFSALNFTDSRGIFQFYDLKNLWTDIQTALENNIKKLNLATEPVSVNEIYQTIYNQAFTNELNGAIPNYNILTKHAVVFGKAENYIQNKAEVLASIKEFVKKQTT